MHTALYLWYYIVLEQFFNQSEAKSLLNLSATIEPMKPVVWYCVMLRTICYFHTSQSYKSCTMTSPTFSSFIQLILLALSAHQSSVWLFCIAILTTLWLKLQLPVLWLLPLSRVPPGWRVSAKGLFKQLGYIHDTLR